MQNLANSKDFLEIFQKLFKLNINLENFSNDLLNHKKDRFQIYSENYSNLSLQVATWAFDLYELLGVSFLKAENTYYSEITNLSPAELLKKFDLENNALDFVTFNFSECDENLEKLETYLKNLQLQIEEIDPSNQFHSELLSIENDMIELRLLIKYFI